jgi:hypothetical protein
MADPNIIPPAYRLFFTTLDPAIGAVGWIAGLFYPNVILSSLGLPTSKTVPPSLEARVLLQSQSGFYLAVGILSVFLLRARPNDLSVWRLLVLSLLVTDVFIVGAGLKGVVEQGKGGDFMFVSSALTTGAIGIIRAAFLLGVGMGKKTGRKSA